LTPPSVETKAPGIPGPRQSKENQCKQGIECKHGRDGPADDHRTETEERDGTKQKVVKLGQHRRARQFVGGSQE
jgi:hypothetical protein